MIIVRKKLLSFRLSSLVIVFFIILLSLKQIRFVDNFQFLYYSPYILLAILFFVGGVLFLYVGRFHILDLMVLLLICSLTASAINSDNILLFLTVYVLPIAGYFVFRVNFNKYTDIYKLLLYLSIFISSLLIVEFITENYTNNKVFNYEGLSSDYIQKGAIYGGNRMDKNFHPLLQLIAPEYSYVERPLGVAMAPQLSGVLVACFILFLLSIIKHKHYLYFSHHKTIYLSMVILLVALLMSLSGTGMMILMVGSLLLFASKKNIFFIIFLAPLFVYLALFLRGYTYDGAGVFLLTYSLKLFSLFYSNLLSSDFVTLIIGGNTSQTVDIDYLNFIVRFGVIGSALFLLLLFMVYYCWGKAFRHTTMDLPLIPVILSILMANFHYDSIYRYPASFLFFMIIGYISYNYSMSHINYTKRQ